MYDSPTIEENRVEEFMLRFMHTVKAKLRSKSLDPNVQVDCDHDVFRYLFGTKGIQSRVPGAIMLDKDDFVDMKLPQSWYYTLDKHGEGYCIEFPVRAKPVLKKTKKIITQMMIEF